MTWDRTWTVACSHGTRRPFIQIVSALVKAILIPPGGSLSSEPSREYRAEGEAISRLRGGRSRRPAHDEGRPGTRAPALHEGETVPPRDPQEGRLVLHQKTRQDRPPPGR